ncbi:MAG: aminotransferase class V-fold PLP-dependent enzyme [Clostridia bacterium]|nr:aminotransferase class V-fold PLP-dependent enzyme [Clostridia bacterium]
MIYLDNSATTYPKPQKVSVAVSQALRASANPGRSGHSMSLAAAKTIYDARITAAEFFGISSPENVIFMQNCTMALNTAIKGVLKKGDHVVVSALEHNAVMRPLKALESAGVSVTKAEVSADDDDKTVDNFRKSINANTKAIICTHASNVWGIRLPIERLCALAHTYGLVFIVDAAQSAGVLPLNVGEMGYDIVCAAGHKGLYGPMGTGMMLLSGSVLPEEIMQGGTGSNSISLTQPVELPDRYESGTVNLPGIAGLKAGIDFVRARGIDHIFSHELSLVTSLYKRLDKMPHVRLYTPKPDSGHCVPVLSFNVEGLDSEDCAARLSENGVAVRAGLHCSPCAHEALGTLETGAVRISPSVFTKHSDIERTAHIISKLK